jgi:uncharacterized SAM-binding protein YcdF (DUF218 family)
MIKKTSERLTVILLFLAALWLAGLHNFTRDMQAEGATMPTNRTTDAIVVLTGGTNRLESGFDLLKQQRGRKLFISGVYRGVEVRELMDQWKEEDRAAFDCCVVLGFDADDTLGNARETTEWLKKENYTSIFLVTANYHVKRALFAFERYAPDLKIIPYPVSPQGLDMKNWWRDDRNRSLVIREYSKYVASLLFYLLPEDLL